MKITITRPTYHLSNLLETGETVDLPARLARNMIATGRASQASGNIPPEPEKQEEKWPQSTETTES